MDIISLCYILYEKYSRKVQFGKIFPVDINFNLLSYWIIVNYFNRKIILLYKAIIILDT